MTEMELERRALLGDKAAQAKCVWKEIAVPCQCGEKPIVFREHIKREYIVICPKCGMNTGGCSTLTLALAIWNNRPEPPIGRCKDCGNWYKHHCANGPCAAEPTDAEFFCGNFKPKGDGENGED